MADIRTIEPQKYNKALAKALSDYSEVAQPDWSRLVKSSPHKKRITQDEDFWKNRSASILRQLYINHIVGVERLKTRYGGKKTGVASPLDL